MKGKAKKLTSLMLALMMVVGLFSSMPALATSAAADTTYDNLYASVQGETNANATYKAFAAKAYEEGYPEVARLFLATADAEAKHAADEWAILVDMGATVRPVAEVPTVGTTAQNLQAAIDGETYEYTIMYPGFVATAEAEGATAARRIFNFAMRAEQVHAGNYADVLAHLADAAYLKATYGTVYRCPVCGEVVTDRPSRCPICGTDGSAFVVYSIVKSISVDALALTTVVRNQTYKFEVNLNEGAVDDDIVWTVSNPLYAVVKSDGSITILNKTGTVALIATDPFSNLSHSILLRIV